MAIQYPIATKIIPPDRFPRVTGNILPKNIPCHVRLLRASGPAPESAANVPFDEAKMAAGIKYILATQCSYPPVAKSQMGKNAAAAFPAVEDAPAVHHAVQRGEDDG